MTREVIENYREILIPFMKKCLLETNYENLGESDAEEFEKDFNEICDLTIKALEQEPSKGEKPNGTDKEIHGVREELKAIEKELHNLNRILEKRKI